jgi:hypothetical protein
LPSKSTPVTASEEAITTSLPPSTTLQQNQASVTPQTSSRVNTTAPRDKTPTVVIHHHFEGDMARLKKDFHNKFQRTCSTAYRVKDSIQCQTSTPNDYIELQRFIKGNRGPFSLLQSANAKTYIVVIKGIA